VVENFSGGVLPKLNISYEVLQAVKPDIVLVSMPAFGSTGPWANFRAYGSTVEHSSGLPHLNGYPEDPPTMQHVAYGDAVGGLTGASALLTALRHQARTGQGQFVDLSQVEALHALASHGILEFGANRRPWPRQGNFSPQFAPHGVYRCAGDEDTWIVIQVLDESQWASLQRLASPTLDAFGDISERLAAVGELDAALASWTRNQAGRELMHRLQGAGIPAAVTNSAATLLDDEQLQASGFWQYVPRAFVGAQPGPSAPYRTGAQPLPITAPAPTLGQHNQEVLGGILGLTAQDLDRLSELGVIGTRPRMPSGGN
jgi:crotonobetainyl-CoA:carnitine CoA-transferase CaiB-like acyl-CoA transferase